MRIAGLFISLFGFLISLSIVGAIIGIPLMIIGTLMMIFGGRRRTIINNVVQVSNTVPGTRNGRDDPPPFTGNAVQIGREERRSLPQSSYRTEPQTRGVSISERLAPNIDGVRVFEDIENEISEESIVILRRAKEDGMDVRYMRRDNQVVVQPAEGATLVFVSNADISQFGRRYGYTRW
jgi:hypothetical protein